MWPVHTPQTLYVIAMGLSTHELAQYPTADYAEMERHYRDMQKAWQRQRWERDKLLYQQAPILPRSPYPSVISQVAPQRPYLHLWQRIKGVLAVGTGKRRRFRKVPRLWTIPVKELAPHMLSRAIQSAMDKFPVQMARLLANASMVTR